MNTNISVLITSKCTLNCEYCSSGLPYQTKREHLPVEQLMEQVEQILALYSAAGIYVEHLDLLGGEPLLHPQLADIVDTVCRRGEMFHELRILTNGTVLPEEELLETISRQTVPFLMILSDYGSLSPRTAEVCGRLEAHGLRYRVDRYHGSGQYFDGWVSYGQDGIVEGTAEERYRNCAFFQSGTAESFQDRLYPCVRALALDSTGRAEIPAEDYIDLRDAFGENVRKLRSFTTRETPYQTCVRCTGLCENAIRYPAAKQAERC